MLDKVRPS